MLKKSLKLNSKGCPCREKKYTVPILLLAHNFSDDQQHRRNAQEKTDKKNPCRICMLGIQGNNDKGTSETWCVVA